MAVLEPSFWEKIDGAIYTVLTIVGVMGLAVLVLIVCTSLCSRNNDK